jgi:ribosomal protein L30E
MELKIVSKLPSGSGIIGVREICKGVAAGQIKHIVVAKNCPDWLLRKLDATKVQIEQFDGDGRELGTAIGKAFAIAMVGFAE